MPELPEVETIRRQLDPLLRGAGLVDAWAFPSGKFTPALEAVGTLVTGVGRRGKYLLIGLRPRRCGRGAGDPPRHDREAVGHRRDGRVHEPTDRRVELVALDARRADTHRRGAHHEPPPGPVGTRRRALAAVRRRADGSAASPWSPAATHASLPTLAALGPEPFDEAFTPELLRDRREPQRPRALKTQLLSQRVVAGVGNIYADEALWRSGVHPASRRLTRRRAARLRDAVRDVLRDGIDHGGTTLRNYRDAAGGEGTNQRYLDCYGRAGEPCVRCGDELRRTRDRRSRHGALRRRASVVAADRTASGHRILSKLRDTRARTMEHRPVVPC